MNILDPKPITDSDDSTVNNAMTPPESVAADFLENHDPLDDIKLSPSSVPWPGSTFIIRSVVSGHVLTLCDGQVVMASPGTRGSYPLGMHGFQGLARLPEYSFG